MECLKKDCNNDIKELGTDGDVHEVEGVLRRKDKQDKPGINGFQRKVPQYPRGSLPFTLLPQEGGRGSFIPC